MTRQQARPIRPFASARALAAAGVLYAASVAAAAFAQQDPPVKEMTAAEEQTWATAAETTIEELCSACHPIEEIARTRHTWREWNDVITRMGTLGGGGTPEQLTTVKLYMTRYYGLVNVNTASAAELSAVLGLSGKEAAAIVEYRKAHGKFADLAALIKVDGVNRAKLEEQAEALRFN